MLLTVHLCADCLACTTYVHARHLGCFPKSIWELLPTAYDWFQSWFQSAESRSSALLSAEHKHQNNAVCGTGRRHRGSLLCRRALQVVLRARCCACVQRQNAQGDLGFYGFRGPLGSASASHAHVVLWRRLRTSTGRGQRGEVHR